MSYECPEGYGPACRNPVCRSSYDLESHGVHVKGTSVGMTLLMVPELYPHGLEPEPSGVWEPDRKTPTVTKKLW